MTIQRFVRSPWMLLVSVALGAGIAAACGEDNGTTTKCPELPFYDIRSDASDPNPPERQEAAQAGCVTGPGTASTVAPDAGSTD